MLALLLFMAPATGAIAGELRPICRAPAVLDEMARELHKRDYYARIEPRLVGEIPDRAPNTVLCGVTVFTVTYDAYHADGIPLGRCELYAFSVRALSNGFVVRYLRRGWWPPAQW
jgi:hypothetical protein